MVRSEIACDCGKEIGGRHDPFEVAVFVVHHCHRHICTAERFERVHRIDLIGDNRRGFHQSAQVDVSAIDEFGDNVARLDDADDLVHRPFGDQHPTVRERPQDGEQRIMIGIGVDPVEFGARCHDFADGSVSEADNARDDRAFGFFDDT